VTAPAQQWGRTFLDTWLVPRVGELTVAAGQEYGDCITAWWLDRVRRTAQFDDAQFARLLEIIDGRMRLAARTADTPWRFEPDPALEAAIDGYHRRRVQAPLTWAVRPAQGRIPCCGRDWRRVRYRS
jgi:hypothetical protein